MMVKRRKLSNKLNQVIRCCSDSSTPVLVGIPERRANNRRMIGSKMFRTASKIVGKKPWIIPVAGPSLQTHESHETWTHSPERLDTMAVKPMRGSQTMIRPAVAAQKTAVRIFCAYGFMLKLGQITASG